MKKTFIKKISFITTIAILVIFIKSNAQSTDLSITNSTLWSGGDEKTLKKLDVLGDIKLEMTNKAKTTMDLNATFNLKSDNLQGSKVLFTLDDSTFNHAKSTGNNITNIAGNVGIEVKNKSIVVLDTIKSSSTVPTSLSLLVNDSEMSMNQIDFRSPNSTDTVLDFNNTILGKLEVINHEGARGLYNTTINGIKSGTKTVAVYGHIEEITGENATIEIRGDIITYTNTTPTNKRSGIRVTLNNAALRIRGDVDFLNKIDVKNKSEFISSLGILKVVGQMNSINGSKINIGKLLMQSPTYEIQAMGKDSTIKIDEIEFDTASPTSLKITAEDSASINLKNLNLKSGTWNTDNKIEFSSINSTFKIETLSMKDHLNLIFKEGNFDIKYLNVDNNVSQLTGEGTSNNKPTLNMDGIFIRLDDILNSAQTKLDYTNLNIILKADAKNQANGWLTLQNNIPSTTPLVLELNNTKITAVGMQCKGALQCENITITGNQNPTTPTTIINIDEFNSNTQNTSTGTFSLTNTNLTTNKSFEFNGTLQLTNSIADLSNMKGAYNAFNLINSKLNINGALAITLNGNIVVDNSSSLKINSSNIAQSNINIENSGNVSINAKNTFHTIKNTKDFSLNSGNSTINTLNNSGNFSLKGDNSTITNLTNTGEIHLYNSTTISNLTNAGKLNLYQGTTKIQTLEMKDNSSLFLEISSENHSSLETDSIIGNTENTDIEVNFTNPRIFKLGKINKFTVLKTKTGSLGTPKSINVNFLKMEMPFWLKPWHKEDGDNKEIWVNVYIKRDNYKDILHNNSIQDKGTLEFANMIDNIVKNGSINQALEDIINSLDYNSQSSTQYENQRMQSYNSQSSTQYENQRMQSYNSQSSTQYKNQRMQSNFINGLVNNLTSLKPISNEVFLVSMHNNNTDVLENLIEENKTYNGIGDSSVWLKNTGNLIFLNDKNYSKGFTGVNNGLQGGISGSFLGGVNTTISAGINAGYLRGTLGAFTSSTYSYNVSGAISYLNSSYYIVLSGGYNIALYENKRYTEFLNNEYSSNTNTIAKSQAHLQSVMAKLELGINYYSPEITITPKINVSVANMTLQDFQEKGSSGSLNQKGFQTTIIDMGTGVDLHKEFLIQSFLGQKDSFWRPKLSLNAIYRTYTAPLTQASFIDFPSSEYEVSIPAPNYTGIIIQSKAMLSYLKDNIQIDAGYTLEYSFNNYNDHKIFASLKYNF